VAKHRPHQRKKVAAVGSGPRPPTSRVHIGHTVVHAGASFLLPMVWVGISAIVLYERSLGVDAVAIGLSLVLACVLGSRWALAPRVVRPWWTLKVGPSNVTVDGRDLGRARRVFVRHAVSGARRYGYTQRYAAVVCCDGRAIVARSSRSRSEIEALAV